jgi:hypothetical protein
MLKRYLSGVTKLLRGCVKSKKSKVYERLSLGLKLKTGVLLNSRFQNNISGNTIWLKIL